MRLKMPRGWGWLSNPKRAAYNRVTIDPIKVISDMSKQKISKKQNIAPKNIHPASTTQNPRKHKTIQLPESKINWGFLVIFTFAGIFISLFLIVFMGEMQSPNRHSTSNFQQNNLQPKPTSAVQANIIQQTVSSNPQPPTKSPEEQIREMRANQGESFVYEPIIVSPTAPPAQTALRPAESMTVFPQVTEQLPEPVYLQYQPPPTYRHQCPSGQHWVRPYTRRDGTRVEGYCRH